MESRDFNFFFILFLNLEQLLNILALIFEQNRRAKCIHTPIFNS
jgi:hypothetical protein